jgi:hypothetical protein
MGATLLMMGAMGCGGGSTPTAPPVPTPPPTPAVTITANGEGNLVIHPSLDTRFTFALETPIRITETAGGTADWNFARISYFQAGREIERYELGSNDIRAAGVSRISARSNQLMRIAFRNNSDEFDRVDIVLGFADLRDGRQFTVQVPATSFTDVSISLTPLSKPRDGTVRIGP